MKKKGIETDPNGNTVVLFYEPSAVKKKKKEESKLSKRRKDCKMTDAKCPRKWHFLCVHQHMPKEYFL